MWSEGHSHPLLVLQRLAREKVHRYRVRTECVESDQVETMVGGLRDLAKFEMSLADDYRRFLDATLRRDADLAVQLWCENHDKVSVFIESNLHESGRRAA